MLKLADMCQLSAYQREGARAHVERARHKGKNEVGRQGGKGETQRGKRGASGRQGGKKGCGKSKRLGEESVCADRRRLLGGEELCETANA